MCVSYNMALEKLVAIYKIEERIASPPPSYRRGYGFTDENVGDFLDRIDEILKLLPKLNDNAVPIVIAERYFEWISSEIEKRGRPVFGTLYRYHDLHAALRYLVEKRDQPLAKQLPAFDKGAMKKQVQEFEKLKLSIQESKEFYKLYQHEHAKVVRLARDLFVYRQTAGKEQVFEAVWCKAVKLTREWDSEEAELHPLVISTFWKMSLIAPQQG
jgi:hypothetical protein